LRRSSAVALNNLRNATNKDLVAVTILVAQIFFRGTPVHTCPYSDVSVTLGTKSGIEKQVKYICDNRRPTERGE